MAPAEDEPAATVEGGAGEKKPEEPPSSHPYVFQIWPPTQRTRDAVVKRLVETLSSPSVLSKRYGTVPAEEAASLSRQIEEEAYAAAAAAAAQPASASADGTAAAADDPGIETLQIYSKEISNRMLEAVKVRVPSSSASSNDVQTDPSIAASAATEEASSPGSVSS